MGAFFSKIRDALRRLSGTRQLRVVLLGLDSAGKTTILYTLFLGENAAISTTGNPTVGFNCETIEHRHLSMTVWDIGGQERLRALWQHYLQNADCLIWAMDSSDRDRVNEARDELHNILSYEQLRGVPLLIFANKQDLPAALSAEETRACLELDHQDRNIHCQAATATTGEGLTEGLDWIADNTTAEK